MEKDDFLPKVMLLPMLNQVLVLHVEDASGHSNRFTMLSHLTMLAADFFPQLQSNITARDTVVVLIIHISVPYARKSSE